MFVLSRDVSAAKRVIATLLATAIVLWASGAWSTVRAANITDVYDLLSDSSPAASSNHTIEFISPTGVANGEDIVLDFSDGPFDLTGIAEEDIDILIGGVNKPAAQWSVVNGGTDLTITIDTGTIAAATTTRILIGTHATNEGSPDSQMVNPSPADGNQSYEIDISAGTSDSGHTRVVILDTVLVTADVSTQFDFTVHANGVGETVNTSDTTTATSSTTTIPFGNLVANTPVVLSQDLTVVTNAINGFVVTVESDGTLRSSTGADIDDFVDGNSTNAPTAWAAPTNNIAQENTWGHWGITTEDQDAASDSMRTGDEFAAGEWIGASTTPREIFAHDGPADGATPGVGSTTIGFKVQISPLQEAADDYATTLTYIATPTF